jgi:hypothetical protein
MTAEDLGPPTYGDAAARSAREELRSGRWQAASSLIQNSRDWSERLFHFRAVAEWPRERPGVLDRWVEREPDSPIALTVRGIHSIGWAWDARGTGLAASVAPEAFAAFSERLRSARRDLERAAALDARDPTAAAHLVQIARGLGADAAAAQAFEEAIARDRGCRYAHVQRLVSLAPRWSGTDAAMFAFAREAARRAPVGAFHPALIAAAHIEAALFSGEEEQDDTALEMYFANPDVRAELLEAHSRSLGSKLYRADRLSLLDQNIFACALSYAGEWSRARSLFDALGGRWTEYPWAYFARPRQQFERRATLRGPARVELALLAPGVVLLAFAGWIGYDGYEASRRLRAADTAHGLQLVVRSTARVPGGPMADGEVEGEEALQRVRVAGGRKTPRAGERIVVYRSGLDSPRYVSASELEAARPAPVLFGRPWSFKLLLAGALALLGLGFAAASLGGQRLFTS